MKKLTALIAGLAACAALNAAPNIYYIEMGRAYQNYYKAKAAAEQIQASIDATKGELEKMKKTYDEKAKQAQTLLEKANNPALGEDAKKKLQEEIRPIAVECQQIEANMRNISAQANERLRQNADSIRKVHLEEIREIVKKLAEDKKADCIIEKSVCHYSDPKADLTDELIKRINANAPVGK